MIIGAVILAIMSKNNAFLFIIIDLEIHLKTKINNDIKKTWCFDGFTLEAKLVTSKYLIEVHLEILGRSEENMASHLLTNSITWSKSCQFLRSLESLNRWTCTSCTWLPFLILLVKCVLKCDVAHTWRRTSASLNYERFHGHQVKLK